MFITGAGAAEKNSVVMKTFAGICSAFLGLSLLVPQAQAQHQEDALVYRADVVVVGAGSAGLSSAIEAADHKARVLILEKMPIIGGNSSQAAGYMIAVPPQDSERTEKSVRQKVVDMMMREGGPSADENKIRQIVDASRGTIAWLRELGADLKNTDALTVAGTPVAYLPATGVFTVGEEVIKTLVRQVELRNIPMLTLTQVTAVTRDEEGEINGVRAVMGDGRKIEVRAPSVILTTGGFGASDQLMERYLKLPYPMSSTNLPGTTGDGLIMGQELGARVVNLDAAMIHVTTLPFSGLVIPMQARSAGGILVNEKGHRFTNELSSDLEPFYERADGRAWLIVDQDIVDSYPALRNYAQSGFMERGRTDEELARLIRVSPETLVEELSRYRSLVRHQSDTDFGRLTMKSYLTHYPLYAINVRPGIQSTLGGLYTNARAQVLYTSGAPIRGLFAAGEVTGGIFGARRLEGSSLTASIVYGRIAGAEAANFASALHQAKKH